MTVCLSTNGTATFKELNAPTKLLIATTDGVAKMERAGQGAPWQLINRVLEGNHISALMVVPNGIGIFAAVHNGGLYKSADDGATWNRCMSGITIEHVYSLGYRETAFGVTLYAGTEPVALFRSQDGGDSWEELPSIKAVPGHEKWTFPPPPHYPHTKGFMFDPRDPEVFYVTIEQGALLKTTDGGITWRELEAFSRPDDHLRKDIHRLLYRPSRPDEFYMLTGIGLYCSYDAGETWQRRTDEHFRIGYPDQIILSPLDDGLMFMCGAAGSPFTWRKTHKAAGWVLKTTDGGRTWEDANTGLPEMAHANLEAFNAAYYPGGYVLFVGNTDGEVYTSENEGMSWELLAAGLNPVSKGTHFLTLKAVASLAAPAH